MTTDSGDGDEMFEGEPTWLHKMGDYLEWKVLGPNIRDPYQTPLTDKQLEQMLTSEDSLKRHLNLRCLCDGYEVLLIRNLAKPTIRTDHPCLTTLTQAEAISYVDEVGLNEVVTEEMNHIRNEIQEELKRRKAESKKRRAMRPVSNAPTPFAPAPEAKPEPPKARDQSYRIMKK